MKKPISIFIAMMFIGCVGIAVKPDTNGITMLQKSAVSTVGYLIAKNNPRYIPDLMKWYAAFQNLDEFIDVQAEYQSGLQKLVSMISDDPFLQMQIRNCMDMIEITFDGPQLPGELKKYHQAVDFFMIGVAAVEG